MSISGRKIIGITLGDPAGIGPEVTAKALAKTVSRGSVGFVLVGDGASFKRYFSSRFQNAERCSVDNGKGTYQPGKPNAYSGALSFQFLRKSVELLKENKIQALVTAPLSKESVCRVCPGFHGHTEFLADAFAVKKFEMMFVADKLKTVIATRHIPIAQVPKEITRQKVLDAILLLNQSLRQQFRIARPRIAVCGLNPHAGEGGEIGREDIREILPAVKTARGRSIDVSGPFAGDTMFLPERRRDFDAIVSMYHDQGLIAMKTLYFRKVVNMTIGLPFVRTSPAHGTAFDIAGKNRADASSMTEAVRLAAQLL